MFTYPLLVKALTKQTKEISWILKSFKVSSKNKIPKNHLSKEAQNELDKIEEIEKKKQKQFNL